VKRALGLWVVLLTVGACSGEGNTGRKDYDTDDFRLLRAEVPWFNGAPPVIDPMSKSAIVPPIPAYPPINFNRADPGSRVLFDTPEHIKQACAPLEGLTLSQWHLDFEPTAAITTVGAERPAGGKGVAPFFSAYDDKTEGSWHVPGDASWYGDIAGQRGFILPTDLATGQPGITPLPPWGMPSQQIENAPSCDGTPNNWALHVRGGRFNYYGGGAEHPLSLDCSLGSQPEACALLREVVGDGRGDRVLDVSGYDGVGFWARRGPDGGSGLMVLLQDKYTSDRLARTDQGTGHAGVGYCQRIKQCYPTCPDGASCVPLQLLNGDPADMTRCVPNGADPRQAIMEPSLQQQLFPPCGQSTCVPPAYDPDVDYNNTQCKPYNFTGLEENYYCFGATPPPAADERCNDGFVSNVSLSTDWQFYKLPFDRFQQVGFAKKAPANDVPQRTMYSIAFLFSVGYTDFFVDNVRFYRN
jgi:hypothetical protein